MEKNAEQNYTFARQPMDMNLPVLRKKTARGSVPDWENLPPESRQARIDAALAWTRRSVAATGGQGSAHSWHPLLGWARAYPETTGYLVETWRDWAQTNADDSLLKLADKSVNWLETIQLSSGAFAGLLAGNTRPSVFNTSQILLANLPQPSAQKAVSWLLEGLAPDGSWPRHAFVPGFVPSYYTRAVASVLRANEWLQMGDVSPRMRQALHFYAQRFLPNATVRDWGFRSGEAAFTHTMAYTLEGFWDAALHLGESAILEKTMGSVSRFLAERTRAGGRTAGRYAQDWRGDYTFVCVTGNCQWSILCHKIWQHTGEPEYGRVAVALLSEILPFQALGTNKNTFGALPGSAPFWGAYLPFRYPNWAAKFFLDALFRLENHEAV